MKKIILALAGAACMLCASAAQATLYKLDFSASGFSPGIFASRPAPQSTVTGSFMFTAPTLGAPVTSIGAVDLLIDGHRFTLADVGSGAYGNGYVFGATVNGVGINRAGSNDFYLIVSSGLTVFSYAQAGVFDTWVTRGVVATYTEQVPALVPEPGSLALLLAGFAGLGLLRRRRAA